MTELASYLGATRIGRHDIPAEQSRLLYTPAVETLRSTIKGAERERCEVAIVYTLNRFTEITHLSSKTVLIYDRYVGQALNTLTRILHWSPDTKSSTRAFARMFAEQAIIAGDAAGAGVGATLFAEASEHWNLPPSASDPEVAAQVHLQELFVFAHEYCHLIMASSSDFRDSRRRVGDILLEGPDDGDGESEQAYVAFAERYPNYRSFKQWRQMRQDERAFVARHVGEIRGELACDDFALGIVLETCKRQQIDARYGFKSVFLALRNIRSLAYMRRLANPRLARLGMAAAVPERLLQKRQHLLRTGFSLAALAHGVEKELESIQSELMDLSDLHDKQVDYPLLFSIVPQLQKVRMRALKKLGKSQFPEALSVARMLGWDPDADEIEYLVM